MKKPFRKPKNFKCPCSFGTRCCGPQPWAAWEKSPRPPEAWHNCHPEPNFPLQARFLISCFAKFDYLIDALLGRLAFGGSQDLMEKSKPLDGSPPDSPPYTACWGGYPQLVARRNRNTPETKSTVKLKNLRPEPHDLEKKPRSNAPATAKSGR